MNLDIQVQSGSRAATIERPDIVSPQSTPFKWTWCKFGQSILLFVLAAAAEVGGGWLIWQAIRANRPWWWGLLGSVVLIVYGFIPTLQPVAHFARIFAVYGGFFIVYSYAWGWALDNEHPDTGKTNSIIVLMCTFLLFVTKLQ